MLGRLKSPRIGIKKWLLEIFCASLWKSDIDRNIEWWLQWYLWVSDQGWNHDFQVNAPEQYFDAIFKNPWHLKIFIKWLEAWSCENVDFIEEKHYIAKIYRGFEKFCPILEIIKLLFWFVKILDLVSTLCIFPFLNSISYWNAILSLQGKTFVNEDEVSDEDEDCSQCMDR